MNDPGAPSGPSTEELILAMLRDVLARQRGTTAAGPAGAAAGAGPSEASPTPPARVPAPAPAAPMGAGAAGTGPAAPAQVPAVPPASSLMPGTAAAPGRPGPGKPSPAPAGISYDEIAEMERFEAWAREDAPDAPGIAPLARQLIVALLLATVLVNIPLRGGMPLARALPDQRALVVRDGLVLKASGPRIYVLEGNQRRWISSLDAFEHFGYAWDQVHVVGDDFLAAFPDGRPKHVLLKCDSSPHIYRLEDDRKRWIKDIATFVAEGHVWDDVEFVSCERLRGIPDGPPIPTDAGRPDPDASTSMRP